MNIIKRDADLFVSAILLKHFINSRFRKFNYRNIFFRFYNLKYYFPSTDCFDIIDNIFVPFLNQFFLFIGYADESIYVWIGKVSILK